MKLNKKEVEKSLYVFRGKKALHPAINILIGIGIIVALLLVWNFFHTKAGNQFSLDDYLLNSQPVGVLMGNPSLDWISFIVGEVPQAITVASSNTGSVIIISLVWLILVLMLGDILSLFGTFSTISGGSGTKTYEYSPVAWIIGIALAVIAANFKVVMVLAASGFMLVSGVGAFAAILGVVTPFIVYIGVHLLFLQNLKHFFKKKKDMVKYKQGILDLQQGIRGAKQFARDIRA